MLTLPAKLTNVMKLVRRPWVWFLRFRQRRGYGVHSPFAYAFIRDVLLQTWPYYAYEELDRLHPWAERHVTTYPRNCRRMLFRMANAVQPGTMSVLGERATERAYMSAAVPKARWVEGGVADLVLVAHERLSEVPELINPLPPRATLICEGISESKADRAIWNEVKAHARTTITFDLYTYGIALLDRPLTPADYIVCF